LPRSAYGGQQIGMDVPHFAAKAAVEQTIKNYDVPFTILRPGYFMQNDGRLKDVLTEAGVYPMPVGDAGIATVDVRDIGEAAAVSLTQDGHAGQSYDLVSKELLSGAGAAAIWSRVLGKQIRYAGHDNFDALEDRLRNTGTPSWLAYDLRVMFQSYVERGFTTSEAEIFRFAGLLGGDPRSYRSYTEELAKQWAEAHAIAQEVK
jgi:uncharacterized protein YbjT (DUF2867 family)